MLIVTEGERLAYSNTCMDVNNNYRWDMSVDEEVYTDTKARSLADMKTLASKGYRSYAKHLGCVRQPLFDIPLDHIVLDELHLLLRVGDVLLRNLILQVDSMGHKRKEHEGQGSNSIRELEEAVLACGVSFQIRQPTGKPIPGSYDFTALSGKFKLQVMRKLPSKFDTILPDGLSAQVAQLWNVSVVDMHVHTWTYYQYTCI